MRLDGKQQASLLLTGVILVISGSQLDVSLAAFHSWRSVAHPGQHAFVVPHWWTPYTIASAVFAPIWIAVACTTLALSRRWPTVGVIALSSFLIIEPISCASAPSAYTGSGQLLGLEDVPFAVAERASDSEHLYQIDSRLHRIGADTGRFPTSDDELKAAIGSLAFEPSPYQQHGDKLAFDLRLVINQGVPFTTTPEKPGIVYYAVNSSGRQYVLTMSGLNAPIGPQASMMKAEPFVGSKQPWRGLLATEGSLYARR